MSQAFCKITINLSAAAIWQVISDFGAAGDYLAGVFDCTVEGEGVGHGRTLTYADGSTIVERLEALDAGVPAVELRPADRHALWQLPDQRWRVRDLGPNRAELTWSATFEADGLPESEAVALMEGALADNCLALKQFMEAGWWQPVIR